MILVVCVSILFSILATAIMSYISIATSTGPWIEPTLVFLGIIIFRFLLHHRVSASTNAEIGFATICGALGGIIAIACGWAFPTLYFLDPVLFDSWLAQPFYFATLLSVIVLVSGIFGFVIAQVLEPTLLADASITFPIGDLVHKMIFAQNQIRKTIDLLVGATATIILSVFAKCTTYIPEKLSLVPGFTYGLLRVPAICLRFDLLPIFISIGFVTGHVIALPLLYGLLSKVFLIEPIQRYFFPLIATEGFFLAFVAGMVIQGALTSVLEIPKVFKSTLMHAKKNNLFALIKSKSRGSILSLACAYLWPVPLLMGFFYYFKFTFAAQLYLILFTIICTYQVIIIAGKTGLAPFPRFATFVLIPGMFLFNFNAVHVTIVSTFVEVCCGVAVDVLFGRKMAQLANMDKRKTVLFQLLGLVISALSIGVIFYLLINRFGLGSPELFAQRAQARALLVNNKSFDFMVMVLGGIFGFILRQLRVNYLLVLGGLLMPPELSFSLILGGLAAFAVNKHKEEYYPFWSGVFAAGSLWMVIRAIW